MIDGTHLIMLAGKLAAAGQPDEATCRCTVSRAYYGAFHLALAFLGEIGCDVPTNANAHVLVQRYLTASGNMEAQQAGMTLSSLHSERIAADYRLESSRFNVAFARSKVSLAHDVASALGRCRMQAVSDDIKDKIGEYRRRIGDTV